jgi:hypothetical protein
MKEIYLKILMRKIKKKKFRENKFCIEFFETIFFMNAKNKYRPPLPIQQAYRIQANPEQNSNFPIEYQSKTLRSCADLSDLQKLLCHK